MRIALFATVAAYGLAASSIVMAAESAAAVDAAQVSDLVVTRNLEQLPPQILERTGTRVDTVTAEEIHNNGFVDVATTLQNLVPGLQVNSKNGPFDYVDISLQGSRTQDVLWLIDGVRINNRLYAGTTPLDTVPSSMVERIEVLEGGQGLFYGTQGIAGAINIVTKPFSADRRAAFSLGGDSNSGVRGDGFYSNSFGKHQLVAYASIDKSDGTQAFRDVDYQPSATDRSRSYRVMTGGLKYAYDLSDKTRVSASYQYTDADLDFAMPFRVASNINARKEYIATAKLDSDLNDRVSVYLKGYYHWWHTSYDTTYNSLTSPGTKLVIYDKALWGYDDAGVNALARIKLTPGLESFVGYDYQTYGGSDDVLVIRDMHERTNAVFAQLRTTPQMSDKGRVAIGTRYSAPSVGDNSLIWNLSGQYDFSSQLFVRANGGTNFRLPTAEELFADDPFDERGNPALKPERSKNLNVSVGGSFDLGGANALKWELIGFARDITDLIDLDTFDPVKGQDVFGNLTDKVRVRGGELALDARFSDAVSGSASYTYSRSHVTGSNLQLNRIPLQQAKAGLDIHPMGSPFGASATLTWTGDIFISVSGTRINYGNYTVVGAALRYDFDAAQHNRLNLSVENLLDETYGRPQRGCRDTPLDGPNACSIPYTYVNLGPARTLRVSFTHAF